YVNSVVSISDSVQNACIKSYKLKPGVCSVIPRGIDTNVYSFNKKKPIINNPKLLFAGNIKSEKGIDDLISSLKYIKTPLDIKLCGRGENQYIDLITRK